MSDCTVEVEIAASTLKKKVEKHHKKHCRHHNNGRNSGCSNNHSNNNNNHHYIQLKDEDCTCAQEQLKVDEGKTSAMVCSPMVDRKFHRREGVSEKNDTERKLVKEAVKLVARMPIWPISIFFNNL